MTLESEKVKTTILINKTLKKLAQVYAIQNDMTLQEVVEKGLKRILVEEGNESRPPHRPFIDTSL